MLSKNLTVLISGILICMSTVFAQGTTQIKEGYYKTNLSNCLEKVTLSLDGTYHMQAVQDPREKIAKCLVRVERPYISEWKFINNEFVLQNNLNPKEYSRVILEPTGTNKIQETFYKTDGSKSFVRGVWVNIVDEDPTKQSPQKNNTATSKHGVGGTKKVN